MSLKIWFNQSTFEPAPAGMHSGVINLIADLGKQHSDLYGDKSQVVIGVELIDCLMSNGKHYQINQRFGLTMHQKGELRPFIEGLTGQTLSTTTASIYDLPTLLGKACKVLIQHKTNATGQITAFVKAAMPADPNQTTKTQSELLCYDMDAPDPRVLAKLAPWIQDAIANAVPDEKPVLTQVKTSTDTANPFAEEWDRTLPVDWASLCNMD